LFLPHTQKKGPCCITSTGIFFRTNSNSPSRCSLERAELLTEASSSLLWFRSCVSTLHSGTAPRPSDRDVPRNRVSFDGHSSDHQRPMHPPSGLDTPIPMSTVNSVSLSRTGQVPPNTRRFQSREENRSIRQPRPRMHSHVDKMPLSNQRNLSRCELAVPSSCSDHPGLLDRPVQIPNHPLSLPPKLTHRSQSAIANSSARVVQTWRHLTV
jgi:hypothetical protein